MLVITRRSSFYDKFRSYTIYVNGEKVNLTSPTVAISKGIGMVHQHFMLVPSLTVAENMVLGMVPKKGVFIDFKKAVEITEEYSKILKYL